ncbi:MAG: chemotaxis protein CheX [Lachnospiraceae bacterium]|nr:chemotaxis protein CheX [Lachnospiraceae bacterium]
MFGNYFGKYLQEKGVLTEKQYEDLLDELTEARLRLGTLAVLNGMMTNEQADEVNQLQKLQDRRFGDIATEKGYLTDEQVGALLRMQGDQYLLCIQVLTDHDYLSLGEIQKYINSFKREERFSALDLEALKSGDLDKIVPVFTKEASIPPVMKDYMALMARNVVRFISGDLRLKAAQRINDYSNSYMATQEMSGEFKLLVGLSGDKDAFLQAASTFGQEEFTEINEDSLDSVCEFINCSNGLYASKMSEDDVELELMPPVMHTGEVKLWTDGPMYLVPMYIGNRRLELVICLESKWHLSDAAERV